MQSTYNEEGERIHLSAADRTIDYHRDHRGLIDQVTAQDAHPLSYDLLGRLMGLKPPTASPRVTASMPRASSLSYSMAA